MNQFIVVKVNRHLRPHSRQLSRTRHGDEELFPYLGNTVGGLVVLRACFEKAEDIRVKPSRKRLESKQIDAAYPNRLREFLPLLAAHWRTLTKTAAGIALMTKFYTLRDDGEQDFATVLALAGTTDLHDPSVESSNPPETVYSIVSFVESLLEKEDTKPMKGLLLFG